MKIACPACKAVNEQGPACRRCRADLSALFALEARRLALLDAARQKIVDSQCDDALSVLDAADAIRRCDEAVRLRALANLLRGDFGRAWHGYREAGERGV